jgi:hypothetical protein
MSLPFIADSELNPFRSAEARSAAADFDPLRAFVLPTTYDAYLHCLCAHFVLIVCDLKPLT